MRILSQKTIYERDGIRIVIATRCHDSAAVIDCTGPQNVDYSVFRELDEEQTDWEVFPDYDSAEEFAWDLIKPDSRG